MVSVLTGQLHTNLEQAYRTASALAHAPWLMSLDEMATLALVQLYRYWRVYSPQMS